MTKSNERTETEIQGGSDHRRRLAGIVSSAEATNPENTRFADWKKLFAVNVDSVFLGCRAAIPAMRRAGGGSIVNISSIAGLLATPYATAYGATKATVRQLTKSVAQHCAEQKLNIRCNSIHPSEVVTPLLLKLAEDLAKIRGMTAQQVVDESKVFSPMGELIVPEEVAAGVAYLVSDEARHITGTKLIIDAGVINCDSYHLMATRKKA